MKGEYVRKQQYATMSTRGRHARPGLIFRFFRFFVLMSALVLPSAATAFASGPCDSIDWGGGTGPAPPGKLDFIGEILDDASSAPIQGAEVKIFRCDSGGPTYVDNEFTDSGGAFAFESLQVLEGYYLEVLIGPSPAGTSAAYGVTSSQGVNVSMEVDG